MHNLLISIFLIIFAVLISENDSKSNNESVQLAVKYDELLKNFKVHSFNNLIQKDGGNNVRLRLKKELKMCRYRDEGLFPDTVWNWKAGGGCYQYLPIDWFVQKMQMTTRPLTINNVTYRIPVGLTNEGDVLFDYTNPSYSEIIRGSFDGDMFYHKWERCAMNAEVCCSSLMDENNIYPNEAYPCPATWDAWSCFLPTVANSISELPCPDYTSSSSDTPCILYSKKECHVNGTWNKQTDYSTCAAAPVYRKRHNFHVIVLYVSIALSFPAVIIFASYKNLRILRVNLHRNLVVACILRNIFTILSKELVILDSLRPSEESNGVLTENGVGCKILAYLNNVAANAIYACMFMDGFYLHKLIARIFSADPNAIIMYIVTAVLSILPSTIWAVLLATGANEYCWMVDSTWYQWIPDGFRIAILIVNMLLLLDIIRVLISKLSQNVSAQHTKSTLKATLFLMPLFGVPFILTASRNIVNQDSCTAVDNFYYVSYSIQALQGIMVSVLFCYWNQEVHTQIKGTFRKLSLRYQARFGSKNDRRQTTNRRDTPRNVCTNISVLPEFDNNEDNNSFENSNKDVNHPLTENNLHEAVNSPPKGLKTIDSELQRSENETANLENNSLFNRISQFIDESNENLGMSENALAKKS